ncbi:P-loop NTPase [Desulfovibrio mangrovi]|uniref:P-loop NTPase n=1 Tax=Desulfovibrio mangrovi TaxID=2976983 RepID=UPI002245B6A5|nr:P-loop NTPase [Desulfovibrio mangrovi]UZP67597.1 P-loop NTPase [Desulfovibrio mangrovi]
MSKIAKALERAQAERNAGSPTAFAVVHKPVRQALNSMSSGPVAVPKYNMTAVKPSSDKHKEANRVLHGVSNQSVKDSFNVLRTLLLQRTRTNGWNALMVTSPTRGNGKSTVAINLAISIARDASQTALLVDANLRWPSIADTLGVDCERGLTDLLLENLEPPEVLVNPGIDKLVVLGAGRTVQETADLIGAPSMQNLVLEMKHRYPDRYVVFDCPHVLDMPDTMMFASYVDGIVLVVEEGVTTKRELQTAMEMLGNANVVGVVLNKNTAQ